MANSGYVEFRAIPIVQPIGEFFVGSIKFDDLIAISVTHIRQLQDGKDEFMGIQRNLSPKRRLELEKYVNTVDATFPTAVILAVPESCAEFNADTGVMRLTESEGTKFEEIAEIIDGQHRIDGLKHFAGSNFDINVAIFVGADPATQAYLFATVNLAQTKVNKSLVYDLYSLEKNRSPQKSCHHIVVALDEHPGSPFEGRIKRLGTATPNKEKEVLTQAAIVESLLPYLTPDPVTDRDEIRRGIFSPTYSLKLKRKLIFGELWAREKEADITKILLSYFSAVRSKWPAAWDDFETRGNVLPKTNGLKALMRFLRPAYLEVVGDKIGTIPDEAKFEAIFSKVRLSDDEFNTTTFKPGTSGEAALLKILNAALDRDN